MKIRSVKIDREVAKQVFGKRGIEEWVAETKFPAYDASLDLDSAWKKALSALKRGLNKVLPETAEGRVELLRETLEGVDDVGLAKRHGYMIGSIDEKIIGAILKISGFTVDEHPTAYFSREGSNRYNFIPLFQKVPAGRHGNTYAMMRSDGTTTYDLRTLLTQSRLRQEIERFAALEPETERMSVLQHFIIRGEFVPSPRLDDRTRDELIAYAEEMGYPVRLELTYRESKDYDLRFVSDNAMSKLWQYAMGRGDKPYEYVRLLIMEFLRYFGELQGKAVDRTDEKAAYAKAFQTKKNIPKTHLAVMNANAFLDAHGYVELDQDVDLEKFTVIEDNYRALRDAFPYPKNEKSSFRIKKLGNYRAGGIYFPGPNATIFDLNHPDSFVHELFHQLDYTLGKTGPYDTFHEAPAFRHLQERYTALVEREVAHLPEKSPFREAWESKNKYNKDYYLKGAEVFARLGELYIGFKAPQENSLYRSVAELEKSPVHPVDERLIRDAVHYFESILPFAKTKAQEVSA